MSAACVIYLIVYLFSATSDFFGEKQLILFQLNLSITLPVWFGY